MSSSEKLRAELYNAFLKAANSMGGDIKSLSWFGRNRKIIIKKEAA